MLSSKRKTRNILSLIFVAASAAAFQATQPTIAAVRTRSKNKNGRSAPQQQQQQPQTTSGSSCFFLVTAVALRAEQRDGGSSSSSNSNVKLSEKEEEEDDFKAVASASTLLPKTRVGGGDNNNNSPPEEEQDENDRAVLDRLTTPFRIGEAFNKALFAIVFAGILLNSAGYSFMPDNNGNIKIGTMEERRFRDEIQRDMKRPPQ